jgi:SAM-dependent methyltransferase
MDTLKIKRDFDTIATLADHQSSGSDRYDLFILRLVPGSARLVADIGSGLGRLSVKLQAPGRTVLGIDLSPEMVGGARVYGGDSPEVEFFCGDFLTDPHFDRTFDCVVTAATLHHVPLKMGVERLRQMTAVGGRLIINDLRNTTGPVDQLKAYIALSEQGVVRFMRTGNPFSPSRIRKAWKDHGATEQYLTMPEVRSMVQTYLPGARVFQHWAWRYTVVWDRRE